MYSCLSILAYPENKLPLLSFCLFDSVCAPDERSCGLLCAVTAAIRGLCMIPMSHTVNGSLSYALASQERLLQPQPFSYSI